MSEINDDNKRPSYFSGVQIGDIVTRKEEPPDNLYLVAKEKIEETFYDGPIRYLTLYSLENDLLPRWRSKRSERGRQILRCKL